MIKECEWCGTELLNTKSPRRRFCNDICRARFRRKAASETGTYLVICSCCGKEFRTYHNTKKFCSKECKANNSNLHSSSREKIVLENKCCECGDIYKTTSKAQRFCSYKCKTKHTGKANELKRRKYFIDGDHSITLSKLIEKENNKCYLCNQECNSEDYVIDDKGTVICGNYYPSVDHVVPLSKGGKHEWDNIKLAHRICNIRKSNILKKNLG